MSAIMTGIGALVLLGVGGILGAWLVIRGNR